MMLSSNKRLLAVAMAVFSLMSIEVVSAADKKAGAGATVEQRLERLERILRNQSLSDIVFKLQQLQQEVQQLRGEVELQNHTMDALNSRQRDLYLDIDQRLSRLQPGAASTSATPPDIPALPVTPSVSEKAPVSSPTPIKTPAVTPPNPKQEAAAYQKAFNLLKQGRYKESITSFRAFLKKYPGGNYEDNAQYWLGEASYVNRDFDTALNEFSRVMQNYPQSTKVPGALLKSGYIYYEKRDWTKAHEMFNRLIKEHAGGTEARLAAKRLERMKKEGH